MAKAGATWHDYVGRQMRQWFGHKLRKTPNAGGRRRTRAAPLENYRSIHANTVLLDEWLHWSTRFMTLGLAWCCLVIFDFDLSIYDSIWFDMISIRFDSTRLHSNPIWFDLIWFDVIWVDLIWFGLILVWFDLMWLNWIVFAFSSFNFVLIVFGFGFDFEYAFDFHFCFEVDFDTGRGVEFLVWVPGKSNIARFPTVFPFSFDYY